LHAAAHTNQVEIAEMLIRSKANIEAVTEVRINAFKAFTWVNIKQVTVLFSAYSTVCRKYSTVGHVHNQI